MPISLLDRGSLKYPEYFWRELEKSNAQKGKDAPVAVILQAIADDENALGCTASQSQILQIAKTHQIALKSINAGHLVGPKIREIARTTGENPKLLVVSAHGNPHEVAFGKEHWYNRLFFKNRHAYRESDVKAQDFSDLAPDAQIHLSCCEVGKSLAQRIANIANRTVFAPTEALISERTHLLEEPNNKFRMLSYDARGFQHIYEFKPNKKPEAFSDTFDSAKKRSAFAMMVNYAKRHVSKGNPECQLTMGILCSNGIIDSSEKGKAHWYRLAADQGNPIAQFNLAICYLNGQGGVVKSDKKRVKWLRLAANQRDRAAQNSLGVCYAKGLGGLEKSDKEAVRWYRLAAAQGDAMAQSNLGLLYLEGRGGLPQSEEMAVRWFRFAADQGDPQGQNGLGGCYINGWGGLAQSEKEAVRWFLLAADQGDPQGQYNLGMCYEKGLGGFEKSEKEAVKWFLLAADQGLAEAQKKLDGYKHLRDPTWHKIAVAIRSSSLWKTIAKSFNRQSKTIHQLPLRPIS